MQGGTLSGPNAADRTVSHSVSAMKLDSRTNGRTSRNLTGARQALRKTVFLLTVYLLVLPDARAVVLTPSQVAQYAYNAGFRDLGGDRGLVTAIAIARAESSFKTDAINYNRDAKGNILSTDRGLWQINSRWHPEVPATCALDPACAARETYRITGGGMTWNEWASYNSGRYAQFLGDARTAARPFLQTATMPARITNPSSGSIFSSSTVSFYWSTGQGVSEYFLYVGNSQGGDELYGASAGKGTTHTVSNLPTDGRTIYVRLWSLINGNWQFTDSTYRAFTSRVATGTPARITNPLSGSTFGSTTITFYWSPGQGVSEYFLYVGSSQGENDIYGASVKKNLSQRVNNLPTDGRRIYVRLWSNINGTWQSNDYSYHALRR
jgi:hypothetical protein